MNQLSIKDELSDFLLYTAPNGDVKVEVILSEETVWLNQKNVAMLFGVQVPAISKHLNNIYEAGELERDSTVSILETVRQEGNRNVKRSVEYFNLDAIISVGYRVNSRQATQFRIWATKLLMNYIQPYHNEPLIKIFTEDRAAYIDALNETEENQDLGIFRNFIAQQEIKFLQAEIAKHKKNDKSFMLMF